jgi:hypothetical protein
MDYLLGGGGWNEFPFLSHQNSKLESSVSREYRSLSKSLFWTEFKRMGGRH